MSKEKLYYTVHQDYQLVWRVSSFSGKSKKQERKYALSVSRKVAVVTTCYEVARQRCRHLNNG